MINLEINRFPIVILGTARTGSSVLTNHLALKYPKLRLWSEPDHKSETLCDFIEYAKISDEYIVKILASSLNKYPIWFIRLKLLNKACHLIKLKRRSIIDQVASYYIASERNIWYYYNHDFNNWKNSITPINIDREIIEGMITLIKTDTQKIEPLLCDDTYFYEDIQDQLDAPDLKTPKPINYIDLLKNIEDLFNFERGN
jgi:hypothetical protein